MKRAKKTSHTPEVLVVAELQNPRWIYRSAEGISKKTNIPKETVKIILDQSNEVRKSLIPGKNGADLYVAKTRKSALGDAWQAFRSMSRAKVGSSDE